MDNVPYILHYTDLGSRFLQNTDNHLSKYMVTQFRKLYIFCLQCFYVVTIFSVVPLAIVILFLFTFKCIFMFLQQIQFQ